MACIGDFTRTSDGFTGTLRTLTVNTKVRLEPAKPSNNEKAPDYRMFAGSAGLPGGAEIGAAWIKTSAKGKPSVSVKLDDPSFPAPVWARLTEVEGSGIWELIWSRDPIKTDKPEAGGQ